MIDQELKPYYDILLSIFLGIIIVLLLHYSYDYPRTIIIDDNFDKTIY